MLQCANFSFRWTQRAALRWSMTSTTLFTATRGSAHASFHWKDEAHSAPPPSQEEPHRPPHQSSSANSDSHGASTAAAGASTSSSNQSGWRIYTSAEPSILPLVDKETSLYTYMTSQWQKADPAKPASIQAETGQVLTFGDMLRATERMAQILYHKAGIRQGDVVCLALLNSVYYAPLVFGTMRLGAIVSTVNLVGASGTLAYHFKSNNAKLVLGMKFFQQSLERAVGQVQKETGTSPQVLYPEDFVNMAEVMPIPEDYHPVTSSQPNDTVFIPFSSGTTGWPKGVQLTNRNLIANIEQACGIFRVRDTDVSVSVLPFFHIFGFTCSLSAVLKAQGTQVVMMKYTVESFLSAVEKYRATMALVAPPILVSLLKNPDTVRKYDVSSLDAMRSGSAPLSAELEHASEKLFPGCSVGQGYGMTEMSPVVNAVPRDAGTNRVYGGSGQLCADTEMRVVRIEDTQQSGEDASSGVDVEPGEDGEVWFRGPQMMRGYLKEEDTAKAKHDGWYRTGDVGHVDQTTGDLVITDRLKELIKYKGFQVSPARLEGVLLQHPWVQDCVVVGVPDPREVSFEMPRALVVLHPDLPVAEAVRASDELYRFILNRMPAHQRLHGGVRIVESIPRNASGKIMRRQIRQSETAMLKNDSNAHAMGEAGEGPSSDEPEVVSV